MIKEENLLILLVSKTFVVKRVRGCKPENRKCEQTKVCGIKKKRGKISLAV
jgi:hypothetical protein